MAIIPVIIIISIIITAQKNKSPIPSSAGKTTPSQQEAGSPLPPMKPETASDYIILAGQYKSAGEYDKAVELLKEAIKPEPEDYRPYALIGDMMAGTGQFKKAELFYRHAMSKPQHDRMTDIKLGRMYRKMGKPDMTEECLTNVLAETADSEEEKRVRAMACLEFSRVESARGDFQKAGEYLDEAFLILPHLSYNNYYLGLWYLELGKYDIAEKAVRKCFQDEDPDESVETSELDYTLAMIYAGKGDNGKAAEYLESAANELKRYRLLELMNRLREENAFEQFRKSKQFEKINEKLQRETSGLNPLSTVDLP